MGAHSMYRFFLFNHWTCLFLFFRRGFRSVLTWSRAANCQGTLWFLTDAQPF